MFIKNLDSKRNVEIISDFPFPAFFSLTFQ